MNRRHALKLMLAAPFAARPLASLPEPCECGGTGWIEMEIIEGAGRWFVKCKTHGDAAGASLNRSIKLNRSLRWFRVPREY